MKRSRFIALILTVLTLPWIAGTTVNAQNQEGDSFLSLNDAVQQGFLVVESVRGTGGSTGTVLNAVLKNISSHTQRVDIYLDSPIFFTNNNPNAQNMIATRVLGQGGQFYINEIDDQKFIEVPANSMLRIMFLAYCYDFGQDNPSPSDQLDISMGIDHLPLDVRQVMQQAMIYEKEFSDDITAVQLALWYAQGNLLSEISKIFPHDEEDLNNMRKILAISLVDSN